MTSPRPETLTPGQMRWLAAQLNPGAAASCDCRTCRARRRVAQYLRDEADRLVASHKPRS
jgi:hypothetical protein